MWRHGRIAVLIHNCLDLSSFPISILRCFFTTSIPCENTGQFHPMGIDSAWVAQARVKVQKNTNYDIKVAVVKLWAHLGHNSGTTVPYP